MPVASSPASAPRAGGPVDPFVRYADVPAAQGLYDPSRETENCGLAVIATLRGTPGHDIVQHALTALRALEHRGACLLYTSPSPRDATLSRMPSSA